MNLTDEASAWFARMHSDQVMSEDETAFVEWLEANPQHRKAYEEVAAVWGGLGELRGDPAMRPLLSHLSDDVEASPKRGLDRRRLLQAAAASIGVLGVAGASWFGVSEFAGAETYQTAFGEQRRVALQDGSTLTLNTETKVRVRFTETERRLWLDQGQAYFIVAPDRTRPFRVFVGDEEVRALGTQFEVRRDGDQMKVTLEEGSVAIIRRASQEVLRADTPAPADVVLEMGQQAIVAPAEAIQVAVVDTRRMTAWRFGQMALDADRLSYAVTELNRYNTRQIVIDSPELQSLQISGLFQTGSPEAFVEAISAVLPVEVASQDERSIHLVYARAN
ncbi:putative iron siderophore sensor protein [alpha proteobacterium U9-1i]|nr:putative iron siderophore sensor protein [alpha proteobacterium U9-1i]